MRIFEKLLFSIFFILININNAFANLQGQDLIDSLLNILPNTKFDTNKVNILNDISFEYSMIEPQEGIKYAKSALDASEKLKWKFGSAYSLNMLGTNYFQLADYNKAIEYFQKSLTQYREIGNKIKVAKVLSNIGNIYAVQSKYPKALDNYLDALWTCEEVKSGETHNILNSIGNIYYQQKNFHQAIIYYEKSIASAEKQGLKSFISRPLYNIGLINFVKEDYGKALDNFKKCLELNEKFNNKIGISNCLSSIGDIFVDESNFDNALLYYRKSLKIDEELGRESGIAVKLYNIATLYIQAEKSRIAKLNGAKPNKKVIREAIANLDKAVIITKKINDMKTLMSNYSELSDAYLLLNDYFNAFFNYKNFKELEDTVYSIANARKIAEVESKRGLEQKEKRIEIQNLELKNQNNLMILFVTISIAVTLIAIILVLLYYNKKKTGKLLEVKNEMISEVNKQLESLNDELMDKNKIISFEREKSDLLLHNVLPDPIADRLREGELTIADYYEQASVAFIDICDFTKFSLNYSPEHIVNLLNIIFIKIDKISEKYKLEKIKTIGDSYMVASGIPEQREDHSLAIANWALEVMDLMNSFRTENNEQLHIRVGIDTGDIVAGVIGEKKLIYDLWGDTVNTASRMEQYGEPGKIQVTKEFKEKLESQSTNSFDFNDRGYIKIKGKGSMRTYFMTNKNQ